MTKRLRMAEEWDQFARALKLADAPAVQRQEMRRAFYGGAWAFYQLQMRQMEDGHEATAADLQMMVDLDRELREFNENVKAGRA